MSDGTVLDGELTMGCFATTMSALLRSKGHRADPRLVFDVPLAAVDLRRLPRTERRDRLDLLARAFGMPLELSPVVDPSAAHAVEISEGRLEGVMLPDRTSTYRGGSRAGWWKVEDPRWMEREAWRIERRHRVVLHGD